ncbi:MAG: hypothetical protein AB2693_32745 [Candidatus Thiodiazotropha sp.]
MDKHWSANLEVKGPSPAAGRNLFNRKLGLSEHSLSIFLTHRPDMIDVQLKGA